MRHDLSDWLIHFVHNRNPENDPDLFFDQGDGCEFPLHADHQRHGELEHWFLNDRDYALPDDADAHSIIKKILRDGHIRAGWSFRGRRATIYGPRPAVCFTEMPLHSLLVYAAQSRQRGNVDSYGIALLKSEVFRAGGRPVIYGLSGSHEECGEHDWPRQLAPSCGIAEHEQYRYVATNLGGNRRIDWTHEREWRWSDVADECSVPGLPAFLVDAGPTFSQAIIIVQTSEEASGLLDVLRTLYDAEYGEYDDHYSKTTLSNTRVIAIEEVISSVGDIRTLRLEDVPEGCRLQFTDVSPPPEFVSRVSQVLNEARETALAAASVWRDTHDRRDVFGFAYTMLSEPQSMLTAALVELDHVHIHGLIGYSIKPLSLLGTSGMLGEEEAAVDAAITVLKREFPETTFWCRTVWD